jgi:hypothetical protein
MTPCWCGSATTRLYPAGWRCGNHTPAKMLGQPEPDQKRYCAPNRCYCQQCPSWTEQPAYTDDLQRTTVDVRAIASGKRRATLGEYRNAQAHLRSKAETEKAR